MNGLIRIFTISKHNLANPNLVFKLDYAAQCLRREFNDESHQTSGIFVIKIGQHKMPNQYFIKGDDDYEI